MIQFSKNYQLPEPPGKWFGDSLVVVDFEGSFQGSAVEAGVVRMDREGRVSCWSGLFAPVTPVTWRETQIHGLSAEDLQGRPYFHEYFEAFREFRKEGVFAAHHAQVENRFIRDAWPMPGWVPNLEEGGEKKAATWGPWLDSCLLGKKVFKGADNHRLRTLIEYTGLQEALDAWASLVCPKGRGQYHSALYDALASWLLLLAMVREKGWKDWSLEQLLRYQKAPTESGGTEQLSLF